MLLPPGDPLIRRTSSAGESPAGSHSTVKAPSAI